MTALSEHRTHEHVRTLLTQASAAADADDMVRAEATCREAAGLDPEAQEPWTILGAIRARQIGLAAAAREMSGGSNPNQSLPVARLVVAARMHAQAGDKHRALMVVEQARNVRPSAEGAAVLHAMLLRAVGRIGAALDELLPVLATAEATDHVREMCLSLLRKEGRADEAVRLARAWVAAQPLSVPARHHLAMLLAERPDDAREALDLVEGLVAGGGRDGRYRSIAAALCLFLGETEQAKDHAEAAVELIPEHSKSHHVLASVRLALGDLKGAEAAARRAVEIAPADPAMRHQLARVLGEQWRMDEAIEVLRSVQDLALDAGSADDPNMLAALAGLEVGHGRLADALPLLDRALALRPNDREIRFCRANVFFGLGRLSEAWSDFIWRPDRTRGKGAMDRHCQPTWDGTALDPKGGSRILIWGEQGIGDEVLGTGLLPEMAARAGAIIVECSSRLVPLFRRSLPEIDFVPRTESVDRRTIADDVVAQCPMHDLIPMLRPSMDSFTNRSRYLQADLRKVEELRARYADRSGRPLVGISWRSTHPRYGIHKTIELEAWQPILEGCDATFVDLQYGDTSSDRARLREALGIEVVHDPTIDPLTDLDAFAAQVAAMDVIVTVSNTTAHFAGALGQPTMLMLPLSIGAIWYWHMERDGRSLWYPTIRQFRQQKSMEWGPVVEQVAQELRATLSVAA